jgi:hypothetical protein
MDDPVLLSQIIVRLATVWIASFGMGEYTHFDVVCWCLPVFGWKSADVDCWTSGDGIIVRFRLFRKSWRNYQQDRPGLYMDFRVSRTIGTVGKRRLIKTIEKDLEGVVTGLWLLNVARNNFDAERLYRRWVIGSWRKKQVNGLFWP